MIRAHEARVIDLLFSAAVGAFGGVLLAVAISGCAAATPVITLPEQVGGMVSTVLTKATGGETHIEATSLVPYTIVVFDERTDRCVIEHEGQHIQDQRDYGYVVWAAQYKYEFLKCMAHAIPTAENVGVCYRANPWERRAFEVQERCEGSRQ